jgi:aryl-alcohol dehydrogenase-like predicted oxidoreductase
VEQRPLGGSGLQISRIGLGTAQFGGDRWLNTWGPQEDDVSIATIRRAVEAGINWLDTAPIYGYGHSEEVVGRALQQLPPVDRPLVFTKCGLEWIPGSIGPSRRRLTALAVRQEVESSLRRLGVERIDLYQVHYPPEEETSSLPEAWAEMGALVEEGKVAAIGVCNAGVAELEVCAAVRHVDSVQSPFSLLRPQGRVDVVPWAATHGSGFIGYRALESGLLTEGFTRERARELPPTDWRSRDPDFQDPRLERNLAIRDALIPIARKLESSVSATAAAWALGCPGVTGVIIGARHPAQIAGWNQAAGLRLEPGDRTRLDDLSGRTVA